MQSETPYFYRPDNAFRTWWIYFGISLVLHVMVFILVITKPSGSYMDARLENNQTIDVRLVSINPEVPMPGEKEAGPSVSTVQTPDDAADLAEEEAVENESPEPESIPVKSGVQKKPNPSDYALKMPESEKKPKVVEKPKVKSSLKEKTFDSEKVIDEAVKRIEEKAKNSRPRALENRIKQMREQVGDQAYKSRTGKKESDADKSSAGSSSGGFSQMQIYQAEVAVSMKQNWAFSEELAGNTQGLESRLVIKILPDGQITDVWYEKRSGNPYLDESAYKTVMKSNPLPPLPDNYSKPFYHVVLGFTPSGLK